MMSILKSNAQSTFANNTYGAARFLGWGTSSGDLWFKTNIDEAINLNASIVDSNQFESDRKVVNDIYIRTWLSGIRDFTTEQRDTLEYIANLDSREYGDAVISARVLLGLEVPHNATFGKGFKPYKRSQKEASKKPIEKEESLVTNLYPNPAKGEIKVDVSEEGTLEMFNLLGEKVIFTTLVKGTTSISTIMLQPGIYIYSIYINGKVAKRDKLVISQ